MLELKIRRTLAVLLAGLFFLVAAVAQLNGAGPLDAFVKAGVSCAVATCLAIALLRTVEDAVAKLSDKTTRTSVVGGAVPLPAEVTGDQSGDR